MSIRNLLALLPLTVLGAACGGAAMPEPPATPDPSAAAAEAKPETPAAPDAAKAADDAKPDAAKDEKKDDKK